jgi:RNA polymerase sigma factor (TIGR02999 family)
MPNSQAEALKIPCPHARRRGQCLAQLKVVQWFESGTVMPDASAEVTRLLDAIDGGDTRAAEALLPLVYDELRLRAGQLLVSERRDHTLQRTALVHEAYLKLARGQLSFQNRKHFFNAAAQAMRRILVDHATQRNALKRGGGQARVNLDDIDVAAESATPLDWVELDEALRRLEEVSPRQHQVIMLRFFSGRTEAEVARMLEISQATVERDWSMARTWLYREMQQNK